MKKIKKWKKMKKMKKNKKIKKWKEKWGKTKGKMRKKGGKNEEK